MEDIRLAVALIGFLSIGTFALTWRLLHDRSAVFLNVMAVVVVGLIAVYVYTVWGQLWIVNWISLPSVIILSNWFPILLAALAAVVWRRMADTTLLRRLPITGLLAIAATYSLTYFIPSEPPKCGDKWDQPAPPLAWPVCLQTTPNTCSAAAAATILNTLEIETTEQEMARLCLTRSGTTWLGLYHGLATKLLGTRHRVEFFEGDIATIQEMAQVHPVLLCCQLDPEIAELVPSYVSDGGWIPGMAHSVVYFGSINELHIIGDPSRGYEMWSSRDLSILWTGTGLHIGHYGQSGKPVP